MTLLPDRSSRILGAAAAATLGLPAADFDPGKPAANCLVVAYDLTKTDPGAVAARHERAPGQILFERATCWTDPPRVTADVTGLLAQTAVPPWAAQLRRLQDGTTGQGPADDRPVEAVAAEIAGAPPERDGGDGTSPPDPDQDLRRFVEAVTAAGTRERDGGWPGGIREYIADAGPVPAAASSEPKHGVPPRSAGRNPATHGPGEFLPGPSSCGHDYWVAMRTRSRTPAVVRY